MCMPVLNQGNQEGILYLENNLSANVFTEERVHILQLLAAQYAVSIRNVRLFADLLEKTEEVHRVTEEANIDYLTELNNVRRFDELFNNVAEAAKIKQKKLTILYIDIDYFKKINDTHGHKEGDIVLKEVSRIIKNTCMDSDIVSRVGGEEFTVVLQDCDPDTALSIAELIRKNVENSHIELSNNIKINATVSIGVASYPDHIEDTELLIEKADEALYEAKRTGRNKVVISR